MKNYYLISGDILALLLVNLIGFISHGEGKTSFLSRFLAAFVPLTFAWLILAPWFALFQPDIIASNLKQLWRVPLAMLFVAPLAVIIRSAILRVNVQPVFVLVFGVSSAFGLVLWRGLYLLLKRKS